MHRQTSSTAASAWMLPAGHAHQKRVADEYEQEVHEIIAACRGDLQGAVTALIRSTNNLSKNFRM